MTPVHRTSLVPVLFVLLVCLSSCVVTESGNPPVIDRDAVSPLGVIGNQFLINGRGAVQPGGGQLFLANLSRSGFSLVDVEDNGDFNVMVPYEVLDSFRMQAIGTNGLYSLPYDFSTTTGDDRIPLAQEMLDCLERSADGDQLILANGCDRELSLRLRASRATTTVSFEDVVLPSGTSESISITTTELPEVVSILETATNDAGGGDPFVGATGRHHGYLV